MINYISNLAARAALRFAAVVLASLMSVPVFAADFTDGDFTFSANSDGTTCTVTGTSLTSGNLNIPATATDPATGTTYSVTAIGRNAFSNCSGFTGSLIIPNSVQTINDNAFYRCKGLTGLLTLPNSVKIIGGGAFWDCSGLNGTLTLPEDLSEIGAYAFVNCSGLTGSLTIPNSVQNIGQNAFSGCSGLDGKLTLPEGLTEIGACAFVNCSGLTGSLTIPNSVQTIGAEAFSGCSGLDGTLTIPNSVQTIWGRAFNNCSSLTGSLTIPNSVKIIGSCTFMGCSGFDGTLTLPEGLTEIGISAFDGCNGFTGSLTLPASLQTIGGSAFKGCSGFTGSLTIPSNVTEISGSAFSGCNGFNGSLTLPDGLTTISVEAFKDCSGLNGTLTLPNSLQTIGAEAFRGCFGFAGSLIIPESVKEIDSRCFDGCDNFSSLTISSSNTLLYGIAFYCNGLKSVTCLGITPPQWKYLYANDHYLFRNYSIPLYVPEESIVLYKATDEWGKFTNVMPIVIDIDGITLNKSELTLIVGESEKLTPTVTPDNATDKSVTWTSNNENAAIVDANGNVTGIAPGTATITATTANGLKATCTVTVKAKVIDVVSITLNVDKAELVEGTTTQLTATITPDNATNKSVNWTSSNDAVATVNADGLVTAVAAGSAVITAKSANGLAATCAVTVKAKVVATESITLNMDKAELVEGTATQLTATVSPDNATDKSVTWSSSDVAVATVDANGLVTAVAAGSATITAKTSNGLTATCAVTVTAKQSGIEGVEGNSAGVRVDGNTIVAPEGSKVYDLTGREVTPTSLTPGIYIVRIPGGKAVKVRI